MKINNFNQIADFLTFESEDDFYHLQVLLRKKDLPDHKKGRNNNARCIKTYYIKSKEHLLSKEEEIISLCELFTARAYINLNRKSFKKAALHLLKEVSNRIVNNQEEYVYRAYESVAGKSLANVGHKKWVIDLDSNNLDDLDILETAINKCNSSAEFNPSTGEYYNILLKIPTVHGWHLITEAFNLLQLEEVKKIIPFDVQKNNPTVLYFNKTNKQ